MSWVSRYLIQRKQNGSDGNSCTYEAGPNAADEFEPKGGIDAYVDQVKFSVFSNIHVKGPGRSCEPELTPF